MDGFRPDDPSAERRRQRWLAFWTPIITLGSIVFSVAMLIAFAKSCGEGPLRMPIVQSKPFDPNPGSHTLDPVNH